jgi:flavin-dependent dehydrogenase
MAPAIRHHVASSVTEWDAVVVGAGPAGAVAARGLARDGASVLLVDRCDFPRWKVCGACLGPTALYVLDSIGLRSVVTDAGAVKLTRLVLVGAGRRAVIPLPDSLALSRAVLDRSLVEAAVGSGVSFRSGARASVEREGNRFVEVLVRQAGVAVTERTRVVIDATGLGSRLGAALPGRRTERAVGFSDVAPRSRVGLGAMFADVDPAVVPGELRMVIARSGYVGMVRLEDGVLNVAAAIDRDALRGGPSAAVESVLREGGAPPLVGSNLTGWNGTPPLTRRPADRARRRLFRLGDAAGYVEPFTGEGIGWALIAGAAVVPVARTAIRGWRDDLVEEWGRVHSRRVERRQWTCRALAVALRRPRVVRPALAVLGRAPQLAIPLVRATSAKAEG